VFTLIRQYVIPNMDLWDNFIYNVNPPAIIATAGGFMKRYLRFVYLEASSIDTATATVAPTIGQKNNRHSCI